MPSAAETSPSFITPPPESSGSSSCRAITPPARRWYWSARRSTRAFAIGRPSSEKPIAPASRELGHLGQLLARHPAGDVGDEADRDRGLALGALADRAEHGGGVDRRRRCWPSRSPRSSRPRRPSGCRSRGPPCAPGPGRGSGRAGRRRPGSASSPSPSTTSAPSISGGAPGSAISAISPSRTTRSRAASRSGARIEETGARERSGSRPARPGDQLGRLGAALRSVGGDVHAGCPIVGVSAGAGPRSGFARSLPASSS